MSDISAEEQERLEEELEKEPELENEISSAEKEIEDAVKKSNIGEKKKEKRKKQLKWGGGAGAALLVAILLYFGLQPGKTGMSYGLCKTFLELTVRYPQYLRVARTDSYGGFRRIWYTQVDAFGEYRMEEIRCYYGGRNENGHPQFKKITIRRQDVPPEIVESFNKSVPAILAYPPDLTVPRDFSNNLEGLRFESDSFRRSLF